MSSREEVSGALSEDQELETFRVERRYKSTDESSPSTIAPSSTVWTSSSTNNVTTSSTTTYIESISTTESTIIGTRRASSSANNTSSTTESTRQQNIDNSNESSPSSTLSSSTVLTITSEQSSSNDEGVSIPTQTLATSSEVSSIEPPLLGMPLPPQIEEKEGKYEIIIKSSYAIELIDEISDNSQDQLYNNCDLPNSCNFDPPKQNCIKTLPFPFNPLLRWLWILTGRELCKPDV